MGDEVVAVVAEVVPSVVVPKVGVSGVGAAPGGEVAVLRAKLVQSELKAAAIKAGIVDLDAIKMLDLASVKLTEAGEVADGAGVMAALRAAKPYLFGASSSSAAAVPRVEAPRTKAAMEMSLEEWRAARAALLRR